MSEEIQNDGQYKRENLLDPTNMSNRGIYDYLGTIQGKFTDLVNAMTQVKGDLDDHRERSLKILDGKLSPEELAAAKLEVSVMETDTINWKESKATGMDSETYSDRQVSELMVQVQLAFKNVSILKYVTTKFPDRFQRDIGEIKAMSEACSRDVGVATNLAHNNTVFRLNQMKFNQALESRGDHLTEMYANPVDQGPGSIDDVD